MLSRKTRRRTRRGARNTCFDGVPFAAGGRPAGRPEKFRFAKYYLASPPYFIRPDRRRRITRPQVLSDKSENPKTPSAPPRYLFITAAHAIFTRTEDIATCLPVKIVDGHPLPLRPDFPPLFKRSFFYFLYLTSIRNRYYVCPKNVYIYIYNTL